MLIESLIRRIGGTQVVLDATKYIFRPEDKAIPSTDLNVPHVAEVADKKHMAIFLSISEGYAVADRDPDEPIKDILLGSDDFESSYVIGERKWTLGEVVLRAHERSGLSVGDWNVQAQTERDDKIELELDRIQEEFDKSAANLNDLAAQQEKEASAAIGGLLNAAALASREELVNKYKEVFQAAPDEALSDDEIRAAIDATGTKPLDKLDREELVTAYKKEFGRTPNKNWEDEQIRAKLVEAAGK